MIIIKRVYSVHVHSAFHIPNEAFCKEMKKENNFNTAVLIKQKKRGHNEIELITIETLGLEHRISCNRITVLQYDKYLLTIEKMCYIAMTRSNNVYSNTCVIS